MAIALPAIFGRRKAEPPTHGDELASFVEAEFTRRQNERRPWELQWALNEEFLNDNQYLQINAQAFFIEEIPRLFAWQEREVFNHIAPIYETRVARLSRVRPRMTVRPGSGDIDDISAAKVSSALLDFAYREQGMEGKAQRLIAWMEMHGTVFLKPVWDPKGGRQLMRVVLNAPTELLDQVLPKDQRPTVDEPREVRALGPEVFGGGVTLADVHEGDVRTDVVPATEIYPDSPWRDSLGDCQSIIHARAYPVDVIHHRWGVYVEPENVTATSMTQAVGTGGLGYGGGGFRTATVRLPNHAIVKEYWERPSGEYPDGRLIVVASKKTLFAGPLPFLDGPDGTHDLPFVRFVSILRPGCIWGKSPIERLIPVQRRYNALRNRMAEYLNRVAIGGWTVEDGTCNDRDLDPAPGMIVHHQRGSRPPQPIQWPPLPAEFAEEFERCMREFTVISGVSEVARFSEGAPGSRAGIALALQLEQDDTRLSTTANRIGEGMAETGRRWLRLYKQYVREPRLLEIAGENEVPDVYEWDATDIRSDNVVIEGGIGLQDTLAQRKQLVLELLAAGLFNNPETGRLDAAARAKVFEMLEMGDWESDAENDEYALNRARALRENQLMAQGQPQPVDPHYDDLVHLKEHLRFRLSFEFDEVAQRMGPAVVAIFDQHEQMHIANLARKRAAQAAAAPPVQTAPVPQKQPRPGALKLPTVPEPGAEPHLQRMAGGGR